jgi:hypothetical protein
MKLAAEGGGHIRSQPRNCAGVEVVQPQHTQLADVSLPELDGTTSGDHVRQPSDAAAAVAAAGSALAAEQTSRAAHDILSAAKTVHASCAHAALVMHMGSL